MQAFLRRVMASSLWAVSLAIPSVHGAGMSPDPSGIWYDPAQPGWGMSINQQGGTMFVALFVYDASHKPTWLVASNVVDTGIQLDPIGVEVFAGTLYRTSGPFFATSTDAAALGVTSVGTLSLARIFGNLTLAYTVDGVTVNKTVQPQTWNSDIALMLGSLSGGIFLTAPSSCQSPLMHLWVAGGVSHGIEVIEQSLIDQLVQTSAGKRRKKLLADWWNALR